MITKALQTYLETVSGITGLVATRIYTRHLSRITSPTYPLITHQRISNIHLHVLGGAAGQATSRIQLDSWGRSISDVETLAEQVRLALDGFTGTMGTVSVAYSRILNEHDLHEAPVNSSHQWLYRIVSEIQIKYAESIPTF